MLSEQGRRLHRHRTLRSRIFGSTRLVILLILLMVLGACMVSAWLTRDAMANFSFLNQGRRGRFGASKKAIVNISPWQTAEALAPLAVTAEEKEFAREAERLADHDVDQAFAAALRQATLQAQHITLSGEALALSQKIDDDAVVEPEGQQGSATPKGH